MPGKEQNATVNSSQITQLVSTRLKMGNATFLKIVISRYAIPWVAVALILLIIMGIQATFGDVRWLIVMLMVILLIIPLATAFFYFHHGMKEITVANTLPHTLTFLETGIKMSRYEDAECEECVAERFMPYSEFSPFYVGTDYILLPLKDKKRGFLWIPSSGFEQVADFKASLERLGRGLRENQSFRKSS